MERASPAVDPDELDENGPVTGPILVVDDEQPIRDLVRVYLEREGFAVLTTGSGAHALELLRTAHPALVVLDLGLPDVPGETILREIREEGGVPVLILTARAAEEDRLSGLGLGADDYVTKPFSPKELRARIAAVLRRTAAPDTEIFRFGDVEVDFTRAEVRRGGQPIEVTPIEFKLLCTFVRRRGRMLSRNQLLDAAWDEGIHVTDRAVDAHLVNLRRKIEPLPAEPRHIVSVRGLGYRFDV